MSDLEKTPGRQALNVMNDLHKDIIFKTPKNTVRKKKKEKVLDEDTYVEQIGKIIQRDFFPDLDKLKAQNEYLDAAERNDVTKMRQLYMKYSGNRPISQRIPSPATFETPANIHNSQTPKQDDDVVSIAESTKETRLSLDQFLNTHTSQDNQSFSDILEESEKKHKEKFSYLYNSENRCEIEKKDQLALPSIEQQASLPSKPLNIDTWGYKNKNYIMYIPDGIELTQEQQLELVKKRQEVVHSNTRLSANPFNLNHSQEAISSMAKHQARANDGKIGVDGKEIVKQSPKVGGFGFVQTPSPRPGANETPLMTWGEVEGTPFRLDTPRGAAFKMAEPPRREQIALALAEKTRRRHQANANAKRDRLATMSPAARRLATGTPTRTPIKRISTPKLNLGIRRGGTATEATTLTDDLLKIDVPKRNKAADFF